MRAWAAILLSALALCAAGRAAADDVSRRVLALELTSLLLDDTARRSLGEQVSSVLIQSIGGTLQERLNRNLHDVEWQTVAVLVRRFIGETFPPSRIVEISARVYARNFDEAELEEILRFQRSPVGRKVARLAPLIAAETVQEVDVEIRQSPALPRLLTELASEFPVLRPRESP